MTMQVTSGARPSANEQIENALASHEEVRLRVQVQIYDTKDRQYEQLRDTYWQISIPSETATLEKVRQLLEGIGGEITRQAQP